jgi:hypothetical protein
MTIFTMKGGKLEPIAVVQGGKAVSFAEFMKPAATAMAPAAPATAPAKDEMKKDAPKK